MIRGLESKTYEERLREKCYILFYYFAKKLTLFYSQKWMMRTVKEEEWNVQMKCPTLKNSLQTSKISKQLHVLKTFFYLKMISNAAILRRLMIKIKSNFFLSSFHEVSRCRSSPNAIRGDGMSLSSQNAGGIKIWNRVKIHFIIFLNRIWNSIHQYILLPRLLSGVLIRFIQMPCESKNLCTSSLEKDRQSWTSYLLTPSIKNMQENLLQSLENQWQQIQIYRF